MSDESDVSTARVLGRLEQSSVAIYDMIERLTSKVDKIADDSHDTRSRLVALEKRMAAIEPSVSEFGIWKERVIGMRIGAGILWAALGSTILGGLSWVMGFLHFGKGP